VHKEQLDWSQSELFLVGSMFKMGRGLEISMQYVLRGVDKHYIHVHFHAKVEVNDAN